MHNNIDQVIDRGEKMENLVNKSEQLGDQVGQLCSSKQVVL